MKAQFSRQDRERIEQGIRAKYAKAALSPEGLFKYPTGRAGLEALNYDPDILSLLPESALSSFCGVGNPFSVGEIHPGESILDIGCGGGVDALVAAVMTGPSGRVVGIDLSADMLETARKNLAESGPDNVVFREASAEELPFPSGSFDVVLSSGVFNLVPDKLKAMEEVFRVLKAGGRLMTADQALTGDLPDDGKARVDTWAG